MSLNWTEELKVLCETEELLSCELYEMQNTSCLGLYVLKQTTKILELKSNRN